MMLYNPGMKAETVQACVVYVSRVRSIESSKQHIFQQSSRRLAAPKINLLKA